MSAKMLKGRSAFTRRRLMIIFILCTMIGLALMTGFSSLHVDNTKYSAVGQRICMYADVPTDGSTPEDHDLISNIQYVAQQLYTSKYFRGNTSGKAVAELGAGLTYTQNIYNRRVVKGNKIFTESISSSSMKNVAEQKYIDGTHVLYRPSTSVDGKTAKFANSVTDISKKFGDLYGLIPNELTKQVVSVVDDPEKEYGITVIGVRDDNAKQKSSALASRASDGNSEAPTLGFDVPEALVKGSDGNYKVTLTLDPVGATRYSRNETKTMASSPQMPDYSSESEGSVSVTIAFDEKWYPISVTTRETYGIEIKGIGAMICHSSLTEVFSEIGNKDIVLPEQEFFESHMGDIGGDGDIPTSDLEASDYLAYAFGKYLSGTQNLDVTANISVGDIDIKNLKLSVNIGTMNIRARYDDLFIEYGKGTAVGRGDDDLVFVTLNDIKGYLPVEKATGLVDDPSVKALMAMFSSGVKLPELDNLIGDDFLDSLTFEKTDKKVVINIPLEIEGLAKIDAKMTLKNNENYDLESITGTVEALGQTITLSVKPAKNLAFEEVDNSYIDLSPVVDFVPAAISTILNNNAYGINGSITVDGNTVGLNAYIARDEFKTVAADAVITALGQNIAVQYVNDTLYASIGNIGVKATADDIPALINDIQKYVSVDTGTLDKVKALLPQTISDWITTAKSLTADEHEIVVGMRILGAPITIKLARDGDTLTGVALNANVDMLGIKFAADVALDITTPDSRDVTAKNIEYIEAKEVPGLIPFILDYANATAFDAKVNGKITVDGVDILLDGVRFGVDVSDGVKVDAIGRITALDQNLDIAYVDDTVYAAIGNIKFKLATADIDAFVPHVEKLLEALGISIDIPQTNAADIDSEQILAIIPTILEAVESVTLNDNTLVLKAAINGGSVALTANIKSGAVEISGAIGNISLNLNGSLKACTPDELDITVEDPQAYSDAVEFVPTLEALTYFIETKAAAASFDVSYGKYEVTGKLALDVSEGLDALKLRLDIDGISGVDVPDVKLALTVIGKTVYVNIDGNINVAISASLDEVSVLLESLASVIPQDVLETIEKALDIANDLEGTVNDMLETGTDSDEQINVNDIRVILDKVLTAVALSAKDSNIGATVSLLPFVDKDITITADVKTDLTRITVDTAIDGTPISAKLFALTPDATVSAPDGDYISIIEFKPIIDAILPVALAEGFGIKVDATVFGVNVAGDITLSLPTEEQGLAVKAALTVGDIPLNIVYKNDNIYLDVNNGEIMISCGTTAEEIEALIHDVAEAIPEFADILNELTDQSTTDKLTLDKLMTANVSLYHTERGFAASVDLSPVGFDASFIIGFGFTDGAFDGMTLDVCARTSDKDEKNDIVLDIDLIAELDESGALKAIRTVEGATFAVNIEITSKAKQTVTLGNTDGYMELASLTDYLKPIMEIVDDAKTAKSLALNINAYVLTNDMRRLTIDGLVELDLDTSAVRVSLTMLDEKIDITYINGIVYIKLGSMLINFAVSGDNNDLIRINAILKEHLPKYLSDELAVLLGIDKENTSALSDMGLIIDRFKAFDKAQTITEKADLLFGTLHNYDGAPSALKTLLDKFSLYMRSGTPTVGLNVAEDITLVVSPYLTSDKTEIAEITLDTEVFGMTVHASVGSPALSNTASGIDLPENSDNYISIVDYVELINNIYHTFTTHNADGDITFTIDKFDFTYKQNDTVVKKDDGSETVTPGKTITVSGVEITDENGEVKTDENGNALTLPVLKGKLVKNASGKYDVNLEAHIKISGISENAGDITLGLYVLTNYLYKADANAPDEEAVLYDQVAFLSYQESTTGYGENVSIDYGSVMQILASALKILGIEDVAQGAPDAADGEEQEQTILQRLIPKEYRVNINSDVFKDMDIKGLDSIREMINDLLSTIADAEDALDDIGAAWKLVTAPEEMADATREDKIDALLGSSDAILDHIKNAINRFKTDDEKEQAPATPEESEITEIEVAAFSDIVNGITLTSVDGELGANVSNELTTGGDGTAELLVSQGKNASGQGILNGISINNLDVNTALIKAEIDFTSGCDDIEIAPDMNALINVTDADDKTTYSNFSNIKHLLFDVINTANLMEFEIGGFERGTGDRIVNTDAIADTINLNISIGDIDVPIYYDVKVKILSKQDRLAMGLITNEQANDVDEPKYKTAAIIELKFQDCKAKLAGGLFGDWVVGDLTTRLYFYDNVLYVDGVESWTEKQLSYGGFLGIGATKMSYFEYKRVYAKYTVNELLYMLSDDGDIETFLKEFLFYLVPLNKNFSVTLLGTLTDVDLQQTIIDAVKPKTDENGDPVKSTATPTIATVFKGYTYTQETVEKEDGTEKNIGTHGMTIGLSELAGNSSLSDLKVALTGANDDDDNLLDNYVSNAMINTSFANIVTLTLNASLANVDGDGANKIKSKGLGGMTITTKDVWSVVNKSFRFDGERRTYNTFADVLKGELPITGNNTNPWVSIWKDAYEAYKAAKEETAA